MPNGEGVCTIDIPSGNFTDAIGNTNAESEQFVWTYDLTPPTITITAMDSGANPVVTGDYISDSVLTLTFTSSESINKFASNDISATNGSISNFAGSGSVYTADFTPTADGECKIYVGAGLYRDSAGGFNTVDSNIITVTNDATAPIPTIIYSQASPFKQGVIVTITAMFSEDMLSSATPQIAIVGTSMDGLTATDMTRVTAREYTYDYTTPSADGSGVITISAGKDLAGNDVVGTPAYGSSFSVNGTDSTEIVSMTTSTSNPHYMWVKSDDVITMKFSSTTAIASPSLTLSSGTIGSSDSVTDSVSITNSDAISLAVSTTVAFNDLTTTPSTPQFSINADNTTTTIRLNGPIYKSDGATRLTATEMIPAITSGTATLTSYTVSTDDDITFTIGLILDGIADGSEVLTLSVYNHPISGEVTLNDLRTPIITNALSVSENNSSATISFSNPVYQSDGSTPLTASDLSLTLASGTARLTSYSVSTSDNTTFTFTLTLSGTSNGSEVLTLGGVVYSSNANNYTATYTVQSSDDNGTVFADLSYDVSKTKTFTLPIVIDKTSPIVTLSGANLTIPLYGRYNEYGVTTSDALSGISDGVTITRDVDTTLPGEYTVTYTVNDVAGNEGTARRHISVPSPICFPLGTLVSCDQGDVCIESLIAGVHTFGGVGMLSLSCSDPYPWVRVLVHVCAGSFGVGVPARDFRVSPAHRVRYGGDLLSAECLVGVVPGVSLVPFSGGPLFNVLLREHVCMTVCGVECDTLDPRNLVSQIVGGAYSPRARDARLRSMSRAVRRNDARAYVGLCAAVSAACRAHAKRVGVRDARVRVRNFL